MTVDDLVGSCTEINSDHAHVLEEHTASIFMAFCGNTANFKLWNLLGFLDPYSKNCAPVHQKTPTNTGTHTKTRAMSRI
jgi:hypothetical protein